ncbi:MAG: insulinase family protein [Verrucomicrobia bacterium]|nr:insulinase family protein [Verrucomicrobiota bacterium]
MKRGGAAAIGLLLMLNSTNLNVSAASAATTPPITFPPNTAQKWILPDGLTIIVKEDRSAPVASVQAWCATGSITEEKHLGAGLSHILEHMLFKGTKTRSTNEIAQKIQDVGGYINAYTSFDRTVFWIDVPKEGVPTALDVLSDAMMNSTLPPQEYAKEQEVIRREFAMGMDDPDRMLTQLLFATAYQQHPYRLPVIGLLDIYNQLTQRDVMQYYKSRYVPNNLTFVVVGDVDGAKVRAQLEAFFKSYPAESLEPVYIPAEPPQLGKREIDNEFATELTHLAMAWHVPGISDPDVPALDVLSVVLGEGRSSRLYRKVREEAGLAFSISAFSYTPGDPGLLGVDAILDPKNRDAAKTLILQIVNDVRQNGITADELAKAKKIALSHELGSLTTMRGQASDLGTNWFLTRNLNFSREYLAKVQNVTLEDVKRVADKYLTDENLTAVSLNPKGSLANNSAASAPVTAGEIQKFELSNGLRVLVREDARLPLISMTAVFRCGLLAETAEDNGITRLAAKTLLKGTKTRTADQISGQLEAVGGAIAADAGNNSIAVKVGVTQPDLALGTDILADVLLNATMPADAVQREKTNQLARIREEEEQPNAVARNQLKAALFPDHPFAMRADGTPESLAHLGTKELLAFRDRYFVAKNGVISVFGDVKAAAVKQVLEQKLGAMKPGELALTHPPVSPEIKADKTVQAEREKAQAVLMVGYRGDDIFNPDHYALDLIDEASSDLGSRFFIRIREQMGLAYYVGAAQMEGLVPGLFTFYLGTDPQKLEPVKAAFLDEIHKLSAEGLTQVELDRAKKKLIGQQEIQNQSNDAFGYSAAVDELLGLGYNHYKELAPRLGAVDLAQIKRVAEKYFAQQPYVLSIVRPPAPASGTKGK